MDSSARQEPDQRPGHGNSAARGAFNYCLHPPSPGAGGEKKSFEGHQVLSCCGSRFPRQCQFPTNSRLSFPSLFSLLFLCPPHARQDSQTPQCSASTGTESSKRPLGDPEEGMGPPHPRKSRKPHGPQPRGTLPGTRGPTVRVAPRTTAIFFPPASLPGQERREKTLRMHVGQGSVGQRIKPENRLFELSGRKKGCPGTELK